MVRGIGLNQHITAKYVNLYIYISGFYDADNRLIEALFKRFAFVVDNLRVKMLIRIDILASEEIDLVISIRTNHISNYDITFQLTVAPLLRPFIKYNVIIRKLTSVPAHSYIIVLIK